MDSKVFVIPDKGVITQHRLVIILKYGVIEDEHIK